MAWTEDGYRCALCNDPECAHKNTKPGYLYDYETGEVEQWRHCLDCGKILPDEDYIPDPAPYMPDYEKLPI